MSMLFCAQLVVPVQATLLGAEQQLKADGFLLMQEECHHSKRHKSQVRMKLAEQLSWVKCCKSCL